MRFRTLFASITVVAATAGLWMPASQIAHAGGPPYYDPFSVDELHSVWVDVEFSKSLHVQNDGPGLIFVVPFDNKGRSVGGKDIYPGQRAEFGAPLGKHLVDVWIKCVDDLNPATQGASGTIIEFW